MNRLITGAMVGIAVIGATMAFVRPAPAANLVDNIDYRALTDHPVIAPSHRMTIEGMGYNGGRLSIPVEGMMLGYAKGSSMLPLAGNQSVLVMTDDFKASDLKVGDFVAVELAIFGKIAHQIVSIEADAKGRYFITKGANNPDADWWPVRDTDIKYLILGVFW